MTITILGPDDPALKALEESCEHHPELDARVEIIPWADYRDTLIASLDTPQSPHQAVCVPGHIWLPELANKGYFFPISELGEDISPNVFANYNETGIVEKVRQESRFQDDWMMLPLFTDGHILFYRSDLVKFPDSVRVGDLAAYAKVMCLPDGVSPLALKAHPSEILLDWLPYLWEFGGDLLDAQGNPIFNSPEAVWALEYYILLKKFAPAKTHQYGNAEIINALVSGEVAAAVSWGGQAAAIFDPKQNAHHADMKTSGILQAWNATWGVCIPANQSRGEAAEALTALMQLMDSQCDLAVTHIAGSPVRKGSYTDTEKAIYPWLSAQKNMLETCQMLPVTPTLGSFLGIIYDAVYSAFIGKETPADALNRAAAEINSML